MRTKISMAFAAVAVSLFVGMPMAGAQTCGYPLQSCLTAETTTTTTPTTTTTDGGQEQGEVGNSVEAQPNGALVISEEGPAATGTLPVTGGDVLGLAVLGVGALAVGTILVRRTRKVQA